MRENQCLRRERVPQLVATAIGILAVAFSATACGRALVVPATPTRAAEVTPLPTSMATPEPLSTDQIECAEATDGKGPLQTLEEAGYGGFQDRYSWAEDVYGIQDKNGEFVPYTLERLLRENPVVPEGSQVCRTVNADLLSKVIPAVGK